MVKKKLFVTLFRAELEDAIEGLQELSVTLERRLKSGEITNYVFNENEALLKNEISGLKKLLPFIDVFDISGYSEIDTLAEALVNMLQMKIEAVDDLGAIREIIRRKQKKILKYFVEQVE